MEMHDGWSESEVPMTQPISPDEGDALKVTVVYRMENNDNKLEVVFNRDISVEEVLAFSATLSAIPIPAPTGGVERETLDAIAAMMSEFVDNWPQPKKVKIALALVAKTMRAALDPPQHVYWMVGEPDCPRELKAGNGELHTLRCKVCGLEDLRANSVCRAALKTGEVDLIAAADFLCCRVRELEGELSDDDLARQYFGHVLPAVARMEAALKGEKS